MCIFICTRVFQSWMRPPLNSLQNLVHKRTNDIIKRVKSDVFVCNNSQEKEQGCLFHCISCKVFNRRCLKRITKNLTLSAADFQSYIRVCIILRQSMTEILFELKSASPLFLQKKLFRLVKHFQSGKSSIFDSRGQGEKGQKVQ